MLKIILAAVSLTIVAFTANAADRGGLESGFHGNTSVTTYIGGPKSHLTQTIRGVYAQEHPVRAHSPRR
jgi:hypothetical protein